MKKILLMCMGGFSTGLLMEKMKDAAKKENEEIEIRAISMSRLADVVSEYDCLLVAPQTGYMMDEIVKTYPDLPVYQIEPMDYGRLNGEKILKQALAL